MPKLRPQMAAGELDARNVDPETICIGERGRDMTGDSEIGIEAPGQRSLRGVNQPARIAHERLRGRPVIQAIEQRLNLVEPIRGGVPSLVPDPQAEVLEQAQDEDGIDARGVSQADVAAGPAVPLPVSLGMSDERYRIERVCRAVERGRHEAVRQVRVGEDAFQAREIARQSGRLEKAGVENLPRVAAGAADVEDARVDQLDDRLPPLEQLADERDGRAGVHCRGAGTRRGGYAWSITLHMKSAVMRARLWQLMHPSCTPF